MARQRVVVFGNGIAEHPRLAPLIREFNWTPETLTSLDRFAKLNSRREVVAALVEPAAMDLPWKQAIAAVRKAAPFAFIILCHRFSYSIDWAEASAEGAFNLLNLPLDLDELRQSLGFVWAAKNKRFHVIPADVGERARLRKRGAARTHAASSVA